ncbi:hypothetical protein C2845_PM09G12500 [Panicum miliaceum]|uniref:Cyclin-D-binding Myb-like transcription factor 1 n=1 Tax=Panicum miliaceum TaxID=4540 RepID=A0A3L6RZC6_PANMI|nr:hypothetical protein C2845_PM09G12500 [Panicum miliaceum]
MQTAVGDFGGENCTNGINGISAPPLGGKCKDSGCTNLTSELVFFLRKRIGMSVLAVGSINGLQERKRAIAFPSATRTHARRRRPTRRPLLRAPPVAVAGDEPPPAGKDERGLQSPHQIGMERGSAAEYIEVKAVVGSNEEKKGQRSKKDKGHRKRKKDKAKGHGGDGDTSIQSDDKNHSVEMEHAEVSAKMAEKPCSEHAEVIMSKRDAKKDRKKKKRNKEVDTISQKQILDAIDGSVGSEYVEMNKGEGEHDNGGGADEEGDGSGDSGLVHGKRFTPEEDAKLMEAIEKYAEMKQLGEKGLEMIRASMKHPELRGCWAEIATSLPHRPQMAVYKRARILLYRSAERKWTQEEYEIVRRFVEKNGTTWKELATDLGKSEIHVKDTWRRMKPKNLKKGSWTQDEYQNLFDLVNLDLRVKAHQKITPSHRQLRDNISWEAISEKLTTRSNKDCCLKWYQQLASPLVKEGIWADTDDYLLMEALQKVDAVCVEDVDWERLLDHRSGELCRQRWNQMVRMIGGHREKPFIEQVEVLARRYCPEMLDYRKAESSDLSPDEFTGGID